METKQSWSSVLKVVKDIKLQLIRKGVELTYDYKNGETCLERWIQQLGDKKYIDIFQHIQTAQNNDLVLIRYGKYSDVFGGESEADYYDFWNMHDNFYRECRSIVIDVRNDVVVIAAPDKFFNINENEEYSIENINKLISTAVKVELSDKLDGSVMAARYYNGNIIMSSSQSVNPESSWRLKDAIRILNENVAYIKMVKQFPDWTFVFEYISLADAHVVNYIKDQEGLYLITVRNAITGEQFPYHTIIGLSEIYDIKTTKLFNKTLDEVMSELDNVPSNEAEGFVLNIVQKDGSFRLVKIKYLDYCGIHKILSSISSINLIIKNISDNTFDDLISKVPEVYRWRVERVSKVVYNYIKDINDKVLSFYDVIKDMELKDAMIYVQQNVDKELRGYVISAYKHGTDDLNYIKSRTGSYKKLTDMGISVDNYKDIFQREDI